MRQLIARLREASWPGLVLIALTAVITIISLVVDARD